MAEPRIRLTFDGVLAAIVVGLLLVATALTLKPFFPAILWSIVLGITASPLNDWILRALPGRRRLAAFLTCILLVLILLLPALVMTRSLIAYTPDIIAWVEQVSATGGRGAPATVEGIPVVGGFLAANWEFVSEHVSAWIAHFKADIESWLLWALQQLETVGVFLFEFGFAIVLAGVYLANQERLSALADAFFSRIGGPFGEHVMEKSVTTTRVTVRSVIGSAIAESVFAMFGYWVAGVPAWLILGGLTFFAAVIQIGAPVVWIPVALWLFANDQVYWALAMVAWGSIVVYGVENVSRPIFAGRAAELPGLLIFVGAVGGLVAWGLIGVFLGPVILAVAYELLQVWLQSDRPWESQPTGAAEGDQAGSAKPAPSGDPPPPNRKRRAAPP